ncbi:MAG: symmetrical bis(5'-nucleosyl)-tetraphosphatase [Acidobacteria bacterium]|nr:symmetrical bis(5'-nucleosyl)-tetraphosphatase [Acidobacteriota bacterium]
MAIYAIGDIQGCYLTLQRLLRRIDFDTANDRLWLAGDLVNRGPRSLEVLRWAYEHQESIQVVLGNHDLKLLACAAGVAPLKPKDTLDDILAAPDRAELLEWLRRRPFLCEDGPVVLVHAGLLPAWKMNQARRYAREIESLLRADDYALLLEEALALKTVWDPKLTGAARWRGLADIFTRMRVCSGDGQPDYSFTGPPEGAPKGLKPWFDVPGPDRDAHTIVFGHWSALNLHIRPGLIALDSGCVWGGSLSAVRLPNIAVFQEPYAD